MCVSALPVLWFHFFFKFIYATSTFMLGAAKIRDWSRINSQFFFTSTQFRMKSVVVDVGTADDKAAVVVVACIYFTRNK